MTLMVAWVPSRKITFFCADGIFITAAITATTSTLGVRTATVVSLEVFAVDTTYIY